MPTELASGVYSIGRDRIEIYAIEEAGKLTLIDAGLKSDWKHINTEITAMGHQLGDIDAVVLTHAHLDHFGCAEQLRQEAGASVRIHEEDAEIILGKAKAKRDPRSKNILRFGMPAFITVFRFLRKGALSQPPTVAEAVSFGDGDVLDVPGHPRVVHVPGHTYGSAAFLLEDRNVIFTGDALVNYNYYARKPGAQVSPSAYNADDKMTVESLARLDGIQASIVLPGHGAPLKEGLGAALAEARRRGMG